MQLNKSRHAILYRNAIVFLFIYLVMMGTVTYLTADRTKDRLIEKTQDAIANFQNIMEQTVPVWNEDDGTYEELTPNLVASFYQHMGVYMRSAAYENIYLRAEIYNGLHETIAKTGNVIIFKDMENVVTHADGSQSGSGRRDRYLWLDDFMSIAEINDFFGKRNVGFLLACEVIGLEGEYGVIPQKITIFNDSANKEVLAEKIFGEITTDAQVFGGSWLLSDLCFEKIESPIGPITKKDVQRYQNCTKIADSLLKQWQEGGSMNGGLPTGTIFRVRYGSLNMTNGYGQSENCYLSFGAEFYPLEIAVSQLVSVYILSFLFLLILLFALSAKLNEIFYKQRALEKSRRDLTNAIVHELKTPLGILRNYSEGLKEKINEDKREHYLDVIINQTEHMDGMVLDMLALSNLESGVKLDLQNHSLTQITRQMVERYQEMMDHKGIAVTVTAPGDCILRCDKKRIEQAISNFLSNAVRHTPENGAIHISITDHQGTLVFAMENTGQPIPADKINDIWDAYYKADPARSNPKGTGLGLSIVKNILTAHGFDYGVANTPSGVKFWFAAKR